MAGVSSANKYGVRIKRDKRRAEMGIVLLRLHRRENGESSARRAGGYEHALFI